MDDQSGDPGGDEASPPQPAAPAEGSEPIDASDAAETHPTGRPAPLDPDRAPPAAPVVGWDTGVQWEAVEAAPGPVERRKLNVGSVFGRTIDMFIRHPLAFIILAAPLAVVGAIGSFVYSAPGASSWASLGILLVTVVVGIVMGLAIVIAADELRAGRPVVHGSVIGRAMSVTVSAVLSAIAQYLVLFGAIVGAAIVLSILFLSSGSVGSRNGPVFALFVIGVFVLVVLVIYVSLRWSLSNAAIALENAGPIQALGRSRFLTKSNVWRIIGLYFALALATGPLSIGLAMLGLASGGSAVIAFLTAAGELLTVPIVTIASATVLGDLAGRPVLPPAAALAPRARGSFVAGLILIGVVASAVALPQMRNAFERLALSGVPAADRGRILAGTTRNPLDPCRPTGVKSTFSTGESIYLGGYFTKALPAGQEARIDVYANGSLVNSAPLSNPSGTVACYYEGDAIVGASPGTYRLVVSLGGETIAEGTFAIQ